MTLTRRTLALAALLALLGIIGQWAGEPLRDWWRYPTGIVLVLLVIEGLAARWQRFPARLEIPEPVYLGRATPLTLHIANPGSRGATIELATVPPAGIAADTEIVRRRIAAAGEASHSIAITPQRLGRHLWPLIPARVRGHFGLAWWPRKLDVAMALTVEPDLLGRPARRTGIARGGDLARAANGHSSELLELRDYRPGDPLRRIDWKATARAQWPIVREYNEDLHLAIMLLIDVGRTSALPAGQLHRLHHYLNTAARLAELAAVNEDEIGLVAFADTPLQALPPLSGSNGLRRLRQQLAALQSQPRESNPLSALLRLRRLVKRRSLVIWFSDLDDTDATGQLARAAELLAPKHLPLLASLRDERVEALRDTAAHHWLTPYHALAAGEALSVTRANILRLQRLGAHVVHAYPEALDAAVLEHYRRLRGRRLA